MHLSPLLDFPGDCLLFPPAADLVKPHPPAPREPWVYSSGLVFPVIFSKTTVGVGPEPGFGPTEKDPASLLGSQVLLK